MCLQLKVVVEWAIPIILRNRYKAQVADYQALVHRNKSNVKTNQIASNLFLKNAFQVTTPRMRN